MTLEQIMKKARTALGTAVLAATLAAGASDAQRGHQYRPPHVITIAEKQFTPGRYDNEVWLVDQQVYRTMMDQIYPLFDMFRRYPDAQYLYLPDCNSFAASQGNMILDSRRIDQWPSDEFEIWFNEAARNDGTGYYPSNPNMPLNVYAIVSPDWTAVCSIMDRKIFPAFIEQTYCAAPEVPQPAPPGRHYHRHHGQQRENQDERRPDHNRRGR